MFTGTAGGYAIYKDWIVIYTEKGQSTCPGAQNKKKKGPWYISPPGKNIDIVKEYADKYNPESVVNL